MEKSEESTLKHKQTYFKCKCDCGTVKDVYAGTLKNGKSKSCGCLISETTIKRCTIHNLRKHRLYNIHRCMINRCYYESSNRYKNYGGRGIQVCDDWLNKDCGFINFYNWSMANGYSKNLSIDRINVNGNYEPSNCRWISQKEQELNKTNTLLYTYKNVTKPIADWARILKIKYATLRWRINNNYKLDETFSEIKKYD